MSSRAQSIYAFAVIAGVATTAAQATPYMIVGNDEKLVWMMRARECSPHPAKTTS